MQYKTDQWTFNPDRREIRFDSKAVSLRPHTAGVLDILCQSAGETVARETFINELWDGNYLIGNKALTNVIWELRQALPDDQNALITVPRKGYCLKVPVERIEPAVVLEKTKRPLWLATVAAGLLAAMLMYLFRPDDHFVQLQNVELVTDVPGFHENPDYDPASDTLLYATINGELASINRITGVSSSSPVEERIISSSQTMFGSPVFSPDGERFAYLESPRNSFGCKVNLASIEGSDVATLADATCIPLGVTPYGLDWHPVEDRLLYSAGLEEGGVAVHELDMISGQISVLTRPEYLDLLPFYEDAGDRFLFVRLTDPEHSFSYRGFADRPAERLIDIPGKYAGVEASSEISGFALTKHDGQNWRFYQHLDDELQEISLAPEGIKTFSLFGSSVFFSVSRARTQIYTARQATDGEYVIDSLQVVRKVDRRPDLGDVSGRLIFVSDRSGYEELWISDIDGESARQITEYQSRIRFPDWSPNEQWVAFNVTDPNEGGLRLEVINLDTGDHWQPQTAAENSFIYPAWDVNSTVLYSLEASDQGLPAVWIHYPFTSEPSRRIEGVIANALYPADRTNAVLFKDKQGNIRLLNTSTAEHSILMPAVDNVGQIYANGRLYYWLTEGDRLSLYENLDGERRKLLDMSTDDLLPKEILFDVSQDGRTIVWSVGRSAQSSIFRGQLTTQ